MASEVVRDGIKRNTFLAGSMTELSGKNGILFCVLAGVMLTGISLAQDSTRGQESESENNPVLTALLHTRGSGLSPTSQPKDVSDQQARTQAILAEALKARTPVHVSLVKSVDARKNKPSAELIATTRQEIRSADGEVVVPVGAAIVGLIREVTLRSPDGQEANIEIAVDHVLLTNGSKTSLARALQFIGHAQTDSSAAQQEPPIDQQARTVEAMRALANPASMGGGMLRDATRLMDAAGDPGQTTGRVNSATSGSQGVVALPNLYLSAQVSGNNKSVFDAKDTRVRLSRGTDMVLSVEGQ